MLTSSFGWGKIAWMSLGLLKVLIMSSVHSNQNPCLQIDALPQASGPELWVCRFAKNAKYKKSSHRNYEEGMTFLLYRITNLL
jgi:hypothetical protein